MKLFSKNDIQKKKTEERAREVAQGVALATRVNELREKTSMEEVRNRMVSAQSRALSDKEIAEKRAETNDVELKLVDAKAQLAEAIKPLDAKWDEVNKAAEANAAEAEALTALRLETEARQNAVAVREKNITESEQRFAVKDEMVQANLLESDSLRDEAKAIREDANAHSKKQAAELKKRETLVVSRETAVSGREEAHGIRELALDKREKHLNDEERRVKDMYATLLRTTERIHGKRKS